MYQYGQSVDMVLPSLVLTFDEYDPSGQRAALVGVDNDHGGKISAALAPEATRLCTMCLVDLAATGNLAYNIIPRSWVFGKRGEMRHFPQLLPRAVCARARHLTRVSLVPRCLLWS